MKILHVIQTIDPSHGGPAVSAPSLSSAQAKLGHDVSLAFLSIRAQSEGIEKTKKNIPYFNRVTLIEISKTGLLDKLFAWNAIKPLFKEIRNVDIVHMHGVWEPVLVLSAIFSFFLKKPYVFSPRGMLDPWSLAQKKWRKKVMFNLVTRHLLNRCAFIHCLNVSEKSLIKPLNLNCTSRIFPNGIFPEQIENKVDKSVFYNSFPELEKKPFILFLSRLHYKKGLDILIDSFIKVEKKIVNLNLVVAGNDDGEKADLEKKVKENNLQSKVFIIGPLHGNQKYSAMRNAECFVLPSRQEGFSMAITEAMGNECAVVISENCHFPEVTQFRAGYEVTLDSSAFSEAIISVVNNIELRNDFIKSAKKLVTSKYSWHEIARNMLIAYEESKKSETLKKTSRH